MAGRTKSGGGDWPYHEDKHGNMVKCRSNPCRRHSNDIMAASPEEAYRKANGDDAGNGVSSIQETIRAMGLEPGTIVLTKKLDMPPSNALIYTSSTWTDVEEDIYKLKYVHMYNAMLPVAQKNGSRRPVKDACKYARRQARAWVDVLHEEVVKSLEEGKYDEDTIYEAIKLKRKQLADALGIHRV